MAENGGTRKWFQKKQETIGDLKKASKGRSGSSKSPSRARGSESSLTESSEGAVSGPVAAFKASPGPDEVSREIPGLDKLEKETGFIVRELIVTEREYVRDLNIICNVFYDPLNDTEEAKKCGMGKKEREKIFGNVKELLCMNKELLKIMEACPTPLGIGKAFVQMAPFLKVYSLYCGNQSESLQELDALRARSSTFSTFLDYCFQRPECRCLDLNAYLIKPVQRICKYPLLLRELLKSTPAGSEENKIIQDAMSNIQDIVMFVNERKRAHEGNQYLLELQDRLDTFLDEKVALISPSRTLKEELPLQKITYDGKVKDGQLHIFNDLILFTTPGKKGDMLKPLVLVPLAEALIRDRQFDDYPFGFEILHLNHCKVYMTAKDTTEKARLLTLINDLQARLPKSRVMPFSLGAEVVPYVDEYIRNKGQVMVDKSLKGVGLAAEAPTGNKPLPKPPAAAGMSSPTLSKASRSEKGVSLPITSATKTPSISTSASTSAIPVCTGAVSTAPKPLPRPPAKPGRGPSPAPTSTPTASAASKFTSTAPQPVSRQATSGSRAAPVTARQATPAQPQPAGFKLATPTRTAMSPRPGSTTPKSPTGAAATAKPASAGRPSYRHTISTTPINEDASAAINAAYNSIRSDGSSTTWMVLAGSKGQLFLESQGTDDVDAVQHLDDAAVQWLYMRVAYTGATTDYPNRAEEIPKFTKFVLVQWTGPNASRMVRMQTLSLKGKVKEYVRHATLELEVQDVADLRRDALVEQLRRCGR